MTKRYDGQGVKIRFEVYQSDLDAIDPCEPQPEGWVQPCVMDGYRQWKDGSYTYDYDPFRRVWYADHEVQIFNYTQSCPPIADFERGQLVGFRQVDPVELDFEIPDRDLSIPGVHTPCWVHVYDPREQILRSFEVFTMRKGFSGGTSFGGYDRRVPPEPPKPCPRCVKRDAKKRDRRRLKELRKRYDQKFPNLAQAEAYDDGYHDANDW